MSCGLTPANGDMPQVTEVCTGWPRGQWDAALSRGELRRAVGTGPPGALPGGPAHGAAATDLPLVPSPVKRRSGTPPRAFPASLGPTGHPTSGTAPSCPSRSCVRGLPLSWLLLVKGTRGACKPVRLCVGKQLSLAGPSRICAWVQAVARLLSVGALHCVTLPFGGAVGTGGWPRRGSTTVVSAAVSGAGGVRGRRGRLAGAGVGELGQPARGALPGGGEGELRGCGLSR